MTSISFVIRRGTPTDAAELAELLRREAEFAAKLTSAALRPDYDWHQFSRRILFDVARAIWLADSSQGLLAFLHARDVAATVPSGTAMFKKTLKRLFGGLLRSAASAQAGLDIQQKRAFIEGVFVSEDARRQGIASALLNACRTWAASTGLQKIEISVLAVNAEALAFWSAHGFSTSKIQMQCAADPRLASVRFRT